MSKKKQTEKTEKLKLKSIPIRFSFLNKKKQDLLSILHKGFVQNHPDRPFVMGGDVPRASWPWRRRRQSREIDYDAKRP